MAVTLVAADPHPLSLLGLAQLLNSEPNLTLLVSCATAAETMQAVMQHQPDMLVIDINLPDRGGLELINELKNSTLDVKIVILTTAMDEEQTIEALRFGVKGLDRRLSLPWA